MKVKSESEVAQSDSLQLHDEEGLTVLLIALSEKAAAPHSSTLAWKIPWMEEPVELQSMGSLRVGQD